MDISGNGIGYTANTTENVELVLTSFNTTDKGIEHIACVTVPDDSDGNFKINVGDVVGSDQASLPTGKYLFKFGLKFGNLNIKSSATTKSIIITVV